MEIKDLFINPNGPSYGNLENRQGLPLSYVAEKLRNCLESTRLGSRGSEDASGHADTAFHYGLVSYLAPQNQLGLANDHGLADQLLGLDSESLSDWLNRISDEGSVTG